MTYLLDTCIISKLRKLRTHPDEKLRKWINKHPETSYFISTLTLGEIQAGISKLNMKNPEEQRHRMLLEDWLFGELVPRFQNRVLPISLEVAFNWGKIIGNGKQNGNNIPFSDGLIAATAMTHGLIVVTDNIKHFKHSGAELLDPWSIYTGRQAYRPQLPKWKEKITDKFIEDAIEEGRE